MSSKTIFLDYQSTDTEKVESKDARAREDIAIDSSSFERVDTRYFLLLFNFFCSEFVNRGYSSLMKFELSKKSANHAEEES